MCHDQRAHQTGADAPAGGPGIVHLVVFVNKLHVESAAEVLTEEVACSALERFAILHHGFNCVCVKCACKTLCCALDAANYWNG